jgi:hypothetical protein
VGPITFGPGDVLFVADNKRATVVAIDVPDPSAAGAGEPFDFDDLDTKLASYLGWLAQGRVGPGPGCAPPHPQRVSVGSARRRGRGDPCPRPARPRHRRTMPNTSGIQLRRRGPGGGSLGRVLLGFPPPYHTMPPSLVVCLASPTAYPVTSP